MAILCPTNVEHVVACRKVVVGKTSEGNGYYTRSAYTDSCAGANCVQDGLVSLTIHPNIQFFLADRLVIRSI